MRSLQYLGHKIDAEGLHSLPEKVRASTEAPCPTNPKQLKAYLGLLTYYAKFLPNLSSLLLPLYSLYKKIVPGSGKTSSKMHLTSLKSYLLHLTCSFTSTRPYQFCCRVMHPIMGLEQSWLTV